MTVILAAKASNGIVVAYDTALPDLETRAITGHQHKVYPIGKGDVILGVAGWGNDITSHMISAKLRGASPDQYLQIIDTAIAQQRQVDREIFEEQHDRGMGVKDWLLQMKVCTYALGFYRSPEYILLANSSYKQQNIQLVSTAAIGSGAYPDVIRLLEEQCDPSRSVEELLPVLHRALARAKAIDRQNYRLLGGHGFGVLDASGYHVVDSSIAQKGTTSH
ncbi:hypothetical protein HYS47_00210 [Candidatus Woesearchaeota archaeon]|nr:hypothetical protein [Candidatus Woesearchaeota archaeon]